MSFSLADLTTPLTREEVERFQYDALAALGVNTTTWRPGAVVRAIITSTSILIVVFSAFIVLVARGGYLETATKIWLTLLARYVYGVEREQATFATGEVTLVNSGGGVYTLDPDDLVLSNPDTGKEYRNTAPFTLNGLATLTIAVQAVEAGSASTAVPGAINTLVTPLIGVTCSNALAIVGRDEEDDASLKRRCSDKLGSLSPNGPPDAYSYVARSAKRADGSTVGVTRTRLVKDGYGNVDLYVATSTGEVTGTVGDTSTDLGVISDEIQRKAVPLCITANVHSATAVPVAVTYTLYCYNTTGRTEAQIKADVATSLATFFSVQPLGGHVISNDPGKIFRNKVEAAITRVFDDESFQVVLTSPSADVELAANEVPVLGTVTGTVYLSTPPDGA